MRKVEDLAKKKKKVSTKWDCKPLKKRLFQKIRPFKYVESHEMLVKILIRKNA